ncbi:MAG: hypothetical protein A2017_02165 [Lentisphaerae bacterium GWF2_44_16]|nr:MAG: hypothetical protein A2017_02165 [Lentisphaerae bacterium GWF2_44_16]
MKTVKYFVPFPDKNSRKFNVSGAGVQEIMRPCIVNRPNGTNDWLFMFFYEPVKIKIKDEIRDFPENSLMIWSKDDGHLYGNHSIQWKHSWIHCYGEIIPKLLKELNIKIRNPIFIKDPSAFEKYILSIYSEITCYKNPDRKILQNLFENFLREISRSSARQKEPGIPQRILSVKRFMDQHSDQRLTLKKLAGMASLSVPHFCSEFKKYIHTAPMEYIIGTRLEQAKYLLLDHNMTISEAAAKVGYNDIFHFSKIFKKHFGRSPRNLR